MSQESPGLESALEAAFEEETPTQEAPDVPEKGTDVPETGTETREASEVDDRSHKPDAEGSTPSPATTPDEGVEDSILKLTPEELKEIKANPHTAKLYKSVMKSATQKWQEISEYRKLWDALQNDPENAIKALAAAKGVALTAPAPEKVVEAEAVDEVMADMTNAFGAEAAAVMKPIFEKLVGSVLSNRIQPMQQATEALQMDARGRQAQSQVAQFKASATEKGWTITPEVEAKMTELGQQLMPAKQIETVEGGVKHLEMLYKLATADTAEAVAEKRVLDRMQKAAQSAEPARGVPSAGREDRSKITAEMDLNQALEVAVDEAVAESR